MGTVLLLSYSISAAGQREKNLFAVQNLFCNEIFYEKTFVFEHIAFCMIRSAQ